MQELIELKSFNVAGVAYRPANVIDELQTGDAIRFVAEPTNPYDAFAIKVEAYHCEDGATPDSWNLIGYIPRKETWIFHLLRIAGVKMELKLFVNHDAT